MQKQFLRKNNPFNILTKMKYIKHKGFMECNEQVGSNMYKVSKEFYEEFLLLELK